MVTKDKCRIDLTHATRLRLSKTLTKRETWDDGLNRLMDTYEEQCMNETRRQGI